MPDAMLAAYANALPGRTANARCAKQCTNVRTVLTKTIGCAEIDMFRYVTRTHAYTIFDLFGLSSLTLERPNSPQSVGEAGPIAAGRPAPPQTA